MSVETRMTRARAGSIPADRDSFDAPLDQEFLDSWRPAPRGPSLSGLDRDGRVGDATSALAHGSLRRSTGGGSGPQPGQEGLGREAASSANWVIRRHLFHRANDPIEVDDDAEEGDHPIPVATVLADVAFQGVPASTLLQYRNFLTNAYDNDDGHLSFASYAGLRDWLAEKVDETSESDTSEDERPKAKAKETKAKETKGGRGASRGGNTSGRMMTVGKVKMGNDELHLEVKAAVKQKLGTRGIANLLKIKGAKNFDMRIESNGTILIGDNNTEAKNGVDSGLVYLDGKVKWKDEEKNAKTEKKKKTEKKEKVTK